MPVRALVRAFCARALTHRAACMFAALRDQFKVFDDKSELEKKQLGAISGKMTNWSLFLVVWAAIITLGVVGIVGLVFRRLRQRAGDVGGDTRPFADAESGSRSDDSSSVVSIGPSSLFDAQSNAGFDVGDDADANDDFADNVSGAAVSVHTYDDDESLAKASGLFDDDDGVVNLAEVHDVNVAPTLGRPNFRHVALGGATGTQPMRGLFVPTPGSSFS